MKRTANAISFFRRLTFVGVLPLVRSSTAGAPGTDRPTLLPILAGHSVGAP